MVRYKFDFIFVDCFSFCVDIGKIIVLINLFKSTYVENVLVRVFVSWAVIVEDR